VDQYIGKMLDNRYEILERIGTGGMAVVYKAKCHRLNRLVAIKILKSDLAQDEDFRRRFNAESQAVAQLSHPNIVSIYDVSRGGDTEYIVMELIDGITLKQYMEKRGQLNWRESLHFISQIMRGLAHAHSRGIVHRDIKPQNIMVLRDGSVRVADFGIACLENSAQTLTQEALGSVHYISPEQARGDRTDARSDIYSSGVVLYEMLTGRLPFEGDSAVSVAIQYLSSIPLAPREINPDIPEQLELICMKAMAPDLEKRYFSADDMTTDLEEFRKNPNVSLDFKLIDLRPEEPDEPTRPLRAAADPHNAKAAPQQRERRGFVDPEYNDGEPPRSTRRQTILMIIVAALALAVAGVLLHSIITSFDSEPIEQYMVPDVLGLTIEQAYERAGVKGIFTIEEAGSEFNKDVLPGQIIRQDPSEGEYRKGTNRVIRVWVSAGEDTVPMPNVEGITPVQAEVELKKLLNQYNLVLEALEKDKQYSDTITPGYIVSTIPAEGEPLRRGDTIRLLVSKGPKPPDTIVVPHFVGLQIDMALPQLPTWKLICDEETDIELVDSLEPAGEIIWQSLDVMTEVPEGSTIQFQVSTGKPPKISETYDLPQDGRESVYVEVYVGDEAEPQFAETVDCSKETVTVTLDGEGVQFISVYFDGELDDYSSHFLDFNLQ